MSNISTINSFGMEDIANNILPTCEDVDNTKMQIRTFLVAQAKRELMRVVKLTNALDKMEDMYTRKAEEHMKEHDDDTAMTYLPKMIETMSECLQRSNDIIRQIAGDEKLFNLLYINMPSAEIKSTGSFDISALDSESKRTRVRDAVSAAVIMMEDIEKSRMVDATVVESELVEEE